MAKLKNRKEIKIKISPESSNKLIVPVTALNPGQKEALKVIADNNTHIVFLDGVAGTGKTFIATMWGLEQLMRNKFDKIILTRPYVEAGGEKMGHLPGSATEKFLPYMAPLMDIIGEQFSAEDMEKLLHDKKIITLPMGFMRGITMKNAFVILDEAQNTTPKQMHMFLTRIGKGSKIVVTGDPSQSDIFGVNGFIDGIRRLEGKVQGVEAVRLDSSCIVRHPIIAEINKCYIEGENPIKL